MAEHTVAKSAEPQTSGAPSARRPPEAATESRLQRMQRSMGNQAFGRAIQTRLIIGPAGDRYEHEADDIAADVMGRHPGAEHGAADHGSGGHGDDAGAYAQRVTREGESADDTLRRRGDAHPPPHALEAIDDRDLAQGGDPLPSSVRHFFEARFARDFSDVRVHTGPAAEDYNDALRAHAFTYGNHIWMGRGQTVHPSFLLAHELVHVIQQSRPRRVPGDGHVPRGIDAESHGPIVRRRRPITERRMPGVAQDHRRALRDRLARAEGGERPRPRRQPKDQDESDQKWSRLQVFASGMDMAAQLLGASGLYFDEAKGKNLVFVGLHPSFVKVYDKDGKALGARIKLKEVKGLFFDPGVYVQGPKGIVALTISQDEKRIGAEASQSVIAHRPYTKEEKEAIAEEYKKATAQGRDPKPPKPGMVDFEALLTDLEGFRSQVRMVSNPLVLYFVPTYTGGAGSGSGGGEERIYSSPIEGRGDGQPPNAPPWPVTEDGPKLVPVDASPTYSAKIDWSANGNYSLASQVISQVGNSIHYRWERFDITEYAKQKIAKDPAATKDANAKPEKTLDERIEEFKKSKVGSGEDVTGSTAARREFKREFEDWWKDTKRAKHDRDNPRGLTVGEQLSNQAANEISLELAPLSLLTTAVGATLRLIADLFAGPRQEQEVNFESQGIFLIRVISTPGINEDTHGKSIIRPPSVAGKVTEVTKIETAVRESLDEPAAQLAELQAQIDLADKAGNKDKADYLRSLLAAAKLRLEGSPIDVLIAKRNEKQKEVDEFRKNYPTLSDYSRQREVDMLQDQIDLYQTHEAKRAEGLKEGETLAAAQRVNATLISEVTGGQYPLLLSAGPMAMAGEKYRWMISDVTNREGDAFIGEGTTPSAAFKWALEEFGRKAAYGRGKIGVRTANLGLETKAPAEFIVESAPADWALAEKRIDDLVTTLALLGLIFASAGTAAALIGAGVAAARLIERWKQGHLYLDAQAVSDVLSILGGLGVGLQLAKGLQVAKLGDTFTILQEGGATEAQLAKAAEALKGAQEASKLIEIANEAINYGGLIWGNVSFIDQMLDINAQESSGAMTHAAARRARAGAISWPCRTTACSSPATSRKRSKPRSRRRRPPAAKSPPRRRRRRRRPSRISRRPIRRRRTSCPPTSPRRTRSRTVIRSPSRCPSASGARRPRSFATRCRPISASGSSSTTRCRTSRCRLITRSTRTRA